MPETGFCYVNLVVLHLRASASSGGKDNKNSKADDGRERSWAICVERAEKVFSN